ncbi:MAG TPA: hypothetical protein VL742_17235 [Casimicrobiaceae bacterium]|nr:hypothetical protein [Casimicrobiaceae bacterium]
MLRMKVGAPVAASLVGASIALWTAAIGAATPERAAAPQLAVGDRWEYRITDNLRRGAVSKLDVEVVSVTAGRARLRFERVYASGRGEWFDEVDRDGNLVSGTLFREPPRPFAPPAQLLAFPLQKGKTWRQTIDTLRKDTSGKDQILIYGRVGSPAAVTVPAGRFEALYVYRTIQLDDSEFWRSRTSITDAIWYTPSAKAPVRIKREAKYNQKDLSNPEVRTESTVLELVAFRPGRGP